MHEDSTGWRKHIAPEIAQSLAAHLHKAQISRDNLIAYETLWNSAQPGEWKIVNGQIVKGQTPVNDPGSLAFLVKCWAIVPALLKIVYKLERIVVDLIAIAVSAGYERRRALDALDNHRAEIAQSKGQTPGPEHEMIILRDSFRMGCLSSEQFTSLYQRWLSGHSIEAEILPDYAEALKRENELCTKIEGAPDQIKKYFRAYCRKTNQ
jgi:hypothetical protein